MVKHIILWKLKEDLADQEAVKAEIKKGLEGLQGKIRGLKEIRVITDGRLDSSSADLMLESTFEDEASLKGYSVHPDHVAVADGVVRPNVATRICLDHVIEA